MGIIMRFVWQTSVVCQNNRTLHDSKIFTFHSRVGVLTIPPPPPPVSDRTPLHIAAERGHALVVEILADKFKASVLDRTKDGSTLMHIASLNGHPEAVMAFLRKGVPLHMPNKVIVMKR